MLRSDLIAAAALAAASALHAQPIVVTGTREPAAADKLAGDIVVIDAETIRNSGLDNLADLLQREAGVQLSRNGGPGQQTSLFIRGAGGGQTLLLVDGVRVGSATVGAPTVEALGLQNIDRIEVLRGPGSSLYGADAIGGVVQVFTKQGSGGLHADGRLAGGSYHGVEASAGGGGSVGRWDLAASLAREQNRGTSATRPSYPFGYDPDRDGYRRDSAQARIGFRPADGHRIGLTLLRSWLDAQYDASFPDPSTADYRTKTRTDVAALDWRGPLAATLVGTLRASHSIDDSRSGAVSVDGFRTTRDGGEAQLAWQTGVLGQLVAAYEHRREKAATPLFDAHRDVDAGVLSLTGEASGFSWQADVRRDHNSDFGGVTTGRVGGSWAIVPGVPGLRLRALAGTTYRAPGFNDLYFPGYGVPTLDAERGRNAELGIVWRRDGGEAGATVYRNRVRNLIAFQSDRSECPLDPSYDFGCARNVGRARLDGVTLSARQRFGDVGLKAGADFVDAHDRDSGDRLPRRAAQQYTAGVDWSRGDWDAALDAVRVGRRPDGGQTLGAETTLDVVGRWRFLRGWTLEARLLNATDRDIEPAAGYRGLGRQAWLGVRYDGAR